MHAVPVFFATTDGQTRRIAEYLVEALHRHGLDSVAVDLASPQAGHVDWTPVRGVIVCASLHIGKHQAAAARFVKANHQYLNVRPSAFFSVSLSAASQRAEEVEAARKIARDFTEAAGWLPARIACIPGRLAYAHYGWLKRWLMRRISAKEGGPTDTSRDWELTRWEEVDRLADEMAREIRGQTAAIA
jgi:menaquinone-dependent protoporphyrinogen oxidase